MKRITANQYQTSERCYKLPKVLNQPVSISIHKVMLHLWK